MNRLEPLKRRREPEEMSRPVETRRNSDWSLLDSAVCAGWGGKIRPSIFCLSVLDASEDPDVCGISREPVTWKHLPRGAQPQLAPV